VFRGNICLHLHDRRFEGRCSSFLKYFGASRRSADLKLHIYVAKYVKILKISKMYSGFKLVDFTGQKISKTFCICDEYVINLFLCIYEVRNGTLKNCLALVLKLCYTMIFYEIG